MNDLGAILSSANTASILSSYNLAKVSPLKEQQDQFSNAKNVESTPSFLEINDQVKISDEAQSLSDSELDNQGSDLFNRQETTTTLNEEPSKELDSVEYPHDLKKDIATELAVELTPAEKQDVAQLQARDAEVKAHEQAHRAAAGGLSTSSASYEYQVGPDGQKYAVGGEVSISFNKSSDPEENIDKAQAMKAAALAPAQPSAQDRSVARSADAIIADAKQVLAEAESESINTLIDSTNKEKPLLNEDEQEDGIETSGTVASAQDQTAVADNGLNSILTPLASNRV